MTQIALRIYTSSGEVEILCGILNVSGNYERITATIDTGAEVSLFPIGLLDRVAHEADSVKTVSLMQAGIAKQEFQGIESIVTIILEDFQGNRTNPIQIPVWFANTRKTLIGFSGLLENGILHLDMPQLSGYLEIEA